MKIRRTFETKVGIKDLKVGDIIKFKLTDGEKVEARAVKEYPGNNMLMLFENCLDETHCMNKNGSTDGGWEQSDMRIWLNTDIINKFPDKIKKHMVPDYSGDYLHLLTLCEVFGENEFTGKKDKKHQIEALKDRKNRIASQGNKDDYASWWLRDVVSASNFAHVNNYGCAYYINASNANVGVRPAFYLSIPNPSGSFRREEQEADK